MCNTDTVVTLVLTAGRMASNEDSPEARAFQQHFPQLVSAIQNPDTLADQLFARNIISIEVHQEVCNHTLTIHHKNRKLLQHVYNQISFVKCGIFWKFLEILKQESYAKELTKDLEVSLTMYSKLNLYNINIIASG